MKEIKVKFWCDATEEVVFVEIYEYEDEEKQIQQAFTKWLDNNEQVGWEKI